jgi:pyruvate, orthophosphate dikinase
MTLVYSFDHAHARPPMELKDLLGGKGANLAEMTSVLGLPVPPGFTITTDACRTYLRGGWPDGLDDEVAAHLTRLETTMGKVLGDEADPLLVSVRSGARASMPGMMDTVLNLGLNDESVVGLANQTGDERFARDSYRRFIQMYAKVVLDVPGERFDEIFDRHREASGVEVDAAIPSDVLAEIIDAYLAVVREHTGESFPQDPRVQLRGAIAAVFRSWTSPRAHAYRTREHIPEDWGTAVNVQAMVFGNRDERSGTGVGFTRNPATGEAGAYGDFLVNAQGEDVVAGIRVPLPIAQMRDSFPAIHDELLGIFGRLEQHYRDMLDTEFTIEQDKLWMLQTRVGKRTGTAALKLAVALTEDPTIGLTHAEAIERVRPEHLDQVLHPQLQLTDAVVLARGLAASPGAGVGHAYFDADRAIEAADRGEPVILVRQETSPEDVHGMSVAEAVLTSRGGLVSHAAVVARGWGKPAVCGAESLDVGDDSFTTDSGTVVREGDVISVDGSTGVVYLGEVELTEGAVPAEFDLVLGWADEVRGEHVTVRVNADTGEDAARARAFGAQGVGLCRTEHMFLGDRLPVVRRMILADTPDDEAAALAELLEVQRADFLEILEAMDGLPVTVRLLDPPLHEFLPSVTELAVQEALGELDADGKAMLVAAERWREENPMLGVRGVRLGILKDGLYEMQVRALLEAAQLRREAGGHPIVEIMVPLIVTRRELDLVRGWITEVIDEVLGADRDPTDILIGTMIETPRAAICAGDIAEAADFFSFGTNDLTQMTFGFSRDDVGPIIDAYRERGLLAHDPFETVDQIGVGELIERGIRDGRSARPGLKMGVCGEHGGDPTSIAFFYGLGVDYVSCSPFRVPIARLAAAQAVLAADRAIAG